MPGIRPLIGISTYLEDQARWGVWELPAALLPAGYHRLVQRSGGLAALLPPDPAPGAAAAAVTRLDGLVVAGGPDVDPARYGAGPGPRTGPPARRRDTWELALIGAALARRLPLLGICRGMQLLNVSRGGTLVQHLDGHRGPAGRFASHPVTPVPGTLLGSLLGDAAVTVPAYHHQAVDRTGDGLTVSARAEDGTVEGLELPVDTHGFALGVQWHPEMGDDLRLTEALVRAASAHGTGR
ncbi:gamma-glutamyl-gamma-aminobutyrate hydrolase family protein [Streptomyces sp. YIM 98790]|uniref:gamma-glutamyl-gamma-aminobutyrate hydrolase family protein n=1 Tax=Streptomyces sp. YIM 98790 TaxID=2689077 RepID=UPI001408BFA5|nr:gamma-glutamyl-gamma-aminobutyrate hydrolase family protein [Streptomyces sp. YIM 98790]